MNEEIAARLDACMTNVEKRLDNIDLKLSNHLEHVAGDIASLKADMGWVKDAKPKGGADWTEWGVRLLIGGLVMQTIAQIFIK